VGSSTAGIEPEEGGRKKLAIPTIQEVEKGSEKEYERPNSFIRRERDNHSPFSRRKIRRVARSRNPRPEEKGKEKCEFLLLSPIGREEELGGIVQHSEDRGDGRKEIASFLLYRVGQKSNRSYLSISTREPSFAMTQKKKEPEKRESLRRFESTTAVERKRDTKKKGGY